MQAWPTVLLSWFSHVNAEFNFLAGVVFANFSTAPLFLYFPFFFFTYNTLGGNHNSVFLISGMTSCLFEYMERNYLEIGCGEICPLHYLFIQIMYLYKYKLKIYSLLIFHYHVTEFWQLGDHSAGFRVPLKHSHHCVVILYCKIL